MRWGLAVAFALPLLAAGRPVAAAEVKVAILGTGHADPFVASWVDSKDGKVTLDDTVADQVYDLFAGVQYLFTEDSQLLLVTGQAGNLKTILPAAKLANNQARTFFVAHFRSQDRTLFLDGTVERSTSDATRGFAQWNLTLLSDDGSSASTVIQQSIAFPVPAPAPTPDPAPNPGSLPFPRG